MLVTHLSYGLKMEICYGIQIIWYPKLFYMVPLGEGDLRMNQLIKRTKAANFTMISNQIFKDKRLSFQAIGFLCNVLSLPDTWHFSINGLSAIHSNSGRRVVESCLFELEWYGYFKRVFQRKSNGQFDSPDYMFFDESQKPDFCEPLPSFKDRDKYTDKKVFSDDLPTTPNYHENLVQPDVSPDVHNVHPVETQENQAFSPDVHCAHAVSAHAACAQQYNTIKIKNSNNISNQSYHTDNDQEPVNNSTDLIDMIHSMIDYDTLIKNNAEQVGVIDDIVNTVKNVYMLKGDRIKIGRQDYALNNVKNHFKKLNAGIIQYTLECLKKSHKMTNPAAYILVCLFNNITSYNVNTYNQDTVKANAAAPATNTAEQRQPVTKPNKFNNFPQRTYDYDALERLLLENGVHNEGGYEYATI